MVHHNEDGTIEFAYFRPGAASVVLAGDFNQWSTNQHTMVRGEGGWWRLRLALPPGEYRFKYVIDDKLWEADFAAFGVEMCRTGGWNSVLWVHDHRRTSADAIAA